LFKGSTLGIVVALSSARLTIGTVGGGGGGGGEGDCCFCSKKRRF